MDFDVQYGPLNDSVLCALEQLWQIRLPEKYRNFLLTFNGGRPAKDSFVFLENEEIGSCVNYFFGVVPINYINILSYIESFKNRIPQNMLPIGSDPCGNLILLSVKNADRGKIYFWDHEMEADEGEIPDYSNLTLIANSFEEFIASLRDEEDL